MCDEEISTTDDIVFKSQYTNCIQYKTKWYWEKSQQQNNIIVITRKIVQLCLDVITVQKERKYQNVFAIKTNHARLYKGVL